MMLYELDAYEVTIHELGKFKYSRFIDLIWACWGHMTYLPLIGDIPV